MDQGNYSYQLYDDATNQSHGAFETMDEARAAAAFDRLKAFTVYHKGDVLHAEEASPAPVFLTQHQMVNVGIGNEPDAPLKYAVEIKHPSIICSLRSTLFATSQAEAEANALDMCPGAELYASWLL